MRLASGCRSPTDPAVPPRSQAEQLQPRLWIRLASCRQWSSEVSRYRRRTICRTCGAEFSRTPCQSDSLSPSPPAALCRQESPAPHFAGDVSPSREARIPLDDCRNTNESKLKPIKKEL